MDLEALRGRLAEIVAEMTRLNTPPDDIEDTAGWDLTEEDAARFDELDDEATKLRATIKAAEERLRKIAESDVIAHIGGSDGSSRGGFDAPNINTKGDPYDVSTLRFDTSVSELVARAETAIEHTTGDDWAKEAASRTLKNVFGDKREVARRYLATGSETYRQAFIKAAGGNAWSLTDVERQTLFRAQSLTNASGGFAVPFTLDPTLVLTNDGRNNPIRGLARTVQITTDNWNGVTSAGATASWDAEAAEVSDDAITLAQPSIDVHKMQVFVPFSVEVQGDWASIESDLRMAMMDARDELEATAHIKGTGSGQPTGIEVALDGGSSELSPATAETFAVADVYETQRQLPPRYRNTADQPAWIAALGTYNDIRQFDTGGGGSLWTQLGGGTPERLLGWRAFEASKVDDSNDIDAAATEDNFILFVGDWSRYVIVDRVGMQIELVPHLFATGNNRPSGQRGLLGWLRTGADSIDDNAFRVMSIPTTA